MTEYTDVPEVNTLYVESENCSKAIEYLDGGGSMSTFTIVPPRPAEGEFVLDTPVSIYMAQQISSEFAASVRTALVAKQNDIADQLAALGVKGAPDKIL